MDKLRKRNFARGNVIKSFSSCSNCTPYLVRIENFAGQGVVLQGAGGAGAAVIQHFATVLHPILLLPLQVCHPLQKNQAWWIVRKYGHVTKCGHAIRYLIFLNNWIQCLIFLNNCVQTDIWRLPKGVLVLCDCNHAEGTVALTASEASWPLRLFQHSFSSSSITWFMALFSHVSTATPTCLSRSRRASAFNFINLRIEKSPKRVKRALSAVARVLNNWTKKVFN